MQTSDYPAGIGAAKSKYVNTHLGAKTLTFNLPSLVPGHVHMFRYRATVAVINAGFTLLAAIPNFKYQLLECAAIAYGGAVSGLTALQVSGTQAGSAAVLFSYAQASLAQSTVLKTATAGTTILADGASFAPCDAGAAVTVAKTGGSAATATGVDIIVSYTIVPA